SQALREAQEAARAGERDAAALRRTAAARIEAAPARLDYLEVTHPTTLEPVARAEPGSRMLVAAFVGTTRLIDNVALP
ncbi:MAG TPA: pantoate--beta-alanine ligase, partial [Anaeromyxobacteraceae bacterium]|nr:pantoate--beta-alanine ligase [Anaeromyxobacteraceae bacterium]